LQNKAVLITEPIASAKTVAIGFWFSVGSRYESSGNQGISHFVEHMLFKGTSNKSAFEIAVEFDKIGGYINAFTEREQMCVYCVVPCFYAKQALSVISQMIYDSTFLPSEVEKERTVIQSEIISSLDDPEEVAMDAVFSSIWKDNPIALNISGSVTDVEAITREDLYDWYEKFIKSGPLTISIAGNFNQEEIYECVNDFPVRKNFENLPSLTVPNWNAGVDFINADFQQEQFFLLYKLDSNIDFKQSLILAILNAIIGDTMSSRLFQSLRENSGYCYNVYSFINLFMHCGFWCFYATSSKENCLNVAKNLIQIVDEFFKNEITLQEINYAKQHLCGEEIMSSDDMEQRMKQMARFYFSGFNQYPQDEIIKLINEITFEDLYDYLNKIKTDLKKSLIIYGPKIKSADKKIIQKEIDYE
jgi:predicted Zn-dependent peptidase